MENPENPPPPNPNVNQLWHILVIVNVRNNFPLYYWAGCFCNWFRNVNHWLWILNLLSLGFGFHLIVRILIGMVEAIKEKDDTMLTDLGVPLSFLLVYLGYLWDTYCHVHLIISVSNRLSSWGWSRKFQRWLICNFTMNLSVLLTRFDTLNQMFWASTASVSLVATIALAHNRRDPTGITEGFGTCYIICGLTNIHAHSKDNNTNPIALLSFFTAALCFICSVSPREAIADEDAIEKLQIQFEQLQLVVLRFRSCLCSRTPPAEEVQPVQELIEEVQPLEELIEEVQIQFEQVHLQEPPTPATLVVLIRQLRSQVEQLQIQVGTFNSCTCSSSRVDAHDEGELHNESSNEENNAQHNASPFPSDAPSRGSHICHSGATEGESSTPAAENRGSRNDKASTGDLEELLKEGSSFKKRKLSSREMQKVVNLPLRQSARLAAVKKGTRGVHVHSDQPSCCHFHGLYQSATISEQLSYEDQSSLLNESASSSKQTEKEIDAAGIIAMLPKEGEEGWPPLRRSTRLRCSAAKKKD